MDLTIGKEIAQRARAFEMRILAYDVHQDVQFAEEHGVIFVPLEQLCLSPQCGFSSTLEGNEVAVEHQKAKLARCVELAEEVWGGL